MVRNFPQLSICLIVFLFFSALQAQGIRRVVIEGGPDGGSFAMDDLTISTDNGTTVNPGAARGLAIHWKLNASLGFQDSNFPHPGSRRPSSRSGPSFSDQDPTFRIPRFACRANEVAEDLHGAPHAAEDLRHLLRVCSLQHLAGHFERLQRVRPHVPGARDRLVLGAADYADPRPARL